MFFFVPIFRNIVFLVIITERFILFSKITWLVAAWSFLLSCVSNFINAPLLYCLHWVKCFPIAILSSIILKIFSKRLVPREQRKSILTRFNLENILSRLALETGTVNNNLIINSKSLQPLLLGAVTILRLVARYETPTSAGLRPATLLKKRLWHRSFPMDFAKFLRTPFFTEHLLWLPLQKQFSNFATSNHHKSYC